MSISNRCNIKRRRKRKKKVTSLTWSFHHLTHIKRSHDLAHFQCCLASALTFVCASNLLLEINNFNFVTELRETMFEISAFENHKSELKQSAELR